GEKWQNAWRPGGATPEVGSSIPANSPAHGHGRVLRGRGGAREPCAHGPAADRRLQGAARGRLDLLVRSPEVRCSLGNAVRDGDEALSGGGVGPGSDGPLRRGVAAGADDPG